MKQIGVKFSEVQRLLLTDVSDSIGANLSDVARAAMYLGMLQIRTLASVDTEKASELVAINNFKAK